MYIYIYIYHHEIYHNFLYNFLYNQILATFERNIHNICHLALLKNHTDASSSQFLPL